MSSVDDRTQPELRTFGPFAVEDGKVRLLGVEIGDWGALLALVVSIATFLWTVTDKLLLHPIPQIVAPQTVEFWCAHWSKTDKGEVCDSDENLLVRAGPVSVVNRASAPHSYVLDSITTEVALLDDRGTSKKSVHLTWQYFSEISISDAKRTPAAPLLVEGGAAVAKEIEFYPRLEIIAGPKGSAPVADRRNFLKFVDFKGLIGTGAVREIRLTFNASTLGKKILFSASCSIPVDDQFVSNAKGPFALFVRDCTPGARE
ncbi:hypothetical protein [Bradyrhizobium sp. AZCC 2289]|uniref:hypothetical protein n=1 Tax=Bradyrhizobium sp. AZCC 2289 TaxID=3117026 RepID=UPI002FF2C98C